MLIRWRLEAGRADRTPEAKAYGTRRILAGRDGTEKVAKRDQEPTNTSGFIENVVF